VRAVRRAAGAGRAEQTPPPSRRRRARAVHRVRPAYGETLRPEEQVFSAMLVRRHLSCRTIIETGPESRGVGYIREKTSWIVVDDINQRRKLPQDLGGRPPNTSRSLTRTCDSSPPARRGRHGSRPTQNPAGDINRYKLNMTTVIKEATDLAFPGDSRENATIRARAGFLWRSTSGHAHGTPSCRLTLIRVEDAVLNPDGSAVGKPDFSIDGVSPSILNATLMTSEAWRLYDLRCRPIANPEQRSFVILSPGRLTARRPPCTTPVAITMLHQHSR
jgi:hypothetical protein